MKLNVLIDEHLTKGLSERRSANAGCRSILCYQTSGRGWYLCDCFRRAVLIVERFFLPANSTTCMGANIFQEEDIGLVFASISSANLTSSLEPR